MQIDADIQRSSLLFGSDGIDRLARSRVIIFGVGGVGSWCAEALLRSGIGHLTLVDADCVDVSNINRQLPATTESIGRPKAEVLRERFATIRPQASVDAVVAFYSEDNAADFALGDYDVVIDAIDSVKAKTHLILHATSTAATRLFSSMGAARRVDPSMVAEAEFWKVRGCPLARALRDRFKAAGTMPRRKFRCVYSEEPIKGEPKGTSMAVTATFGMHLAAMTINYLTNK